MPALVVPCGALNPAVVNVHNPRGRCEALAGQVEVCPGEGPRYGAGRWGEDGYAALKDSWHHTFGQSFKSLAQNMSRFVAQETTNAITMAPTGPGTNEAQISLISYVASAQNRPAESHPTQGMRKTLRLFGEADDLGSEPW